MPVHYLIGDIHGYYKRLVLLMEKLNKRIRAGDTIVFLGDYIDRGPDSYEVVDYLIDISRIEAISTVFLRGNHEDMLLRYLAGRDPMGNFLANGGRATIESYERNCGGDFTIPPEHMEFFRGLRFRYEHDDFIAVHAGFNPSSSVGLQSPADMLWIREEFYRSDNRWDKTVIFGHTPAHHIRQGGAFYFDDRRNIIGIDSGVHEGRVLRCLSWPDREVF